MSDRLPREVWIATITQTDRQTETWQGMVELFLDRMEGFAPMEPDIYCLPEAFPFVNLTAGRPPGVEVAEVPPGPTMAPFAECAGRVARSAVSRPSTAGRSLVSIRSLCELLDRRLLLPWAAGDARHVHSPAELPMEWVGVSQPHPLVSARQRDRAELVSLPVPRGSLYA